MKVDSARLRTFSSAADDAAAAMDAIDVIGSGVPMRGSAAAAASEQAAEFAERMRRCGGRATGINRTARQNLTGLTSDAAHYESRILGTPGARR